LACCEREQVSRNRRTGKRRKKRGLGWEVANVKVAILQRKGGRTSTNAGQAAAVPSPLPYFWQKMEVEGLGAEAAAEEAER
jgi:hypothetical protein